MWFVWKSEELLWSCQERRIHSDMTPSSFPFSFFRKNKKKRNVWEKRKRRKQNRWQNEKWRKTKKTRKYSLHHRHYHRHIQLLRFFSLLFHTTSYNPSSFSRVYCDASEWREAQCVKHQRMNAGDTQTPSLQRKKLYLCILVLTKRRRWRRKHPLFRKETL